MIVNSFVSRFASRRASTLFEASLRVITIVFSVGVSTSKEPSKSNALDVFLKRNKLI